MRAAVTAAVLLALGAGLRTAGTVGGAALLGTASAHLETRLGGKPAAARACAAGGASGVALTVAKVPRLLLHRIPEWHGRPPRSARVAQGAQARRGEPPHLDP